MNDADYKPPTALSIYTFCYALWLLHSLRNAFSMTFHPRCYIFFSQKLCLHLSFHSGGTRYKADYLQSLPKAFLSATHHLIFLSQVFAQTFQKHCFSRLAAEKAICYLHYDALLIPESCEYRHLAFLWCRLSYTLLESWFYQARILLLLCELWLRCFFSRNQSSPEWLLSTLGVWKFHVLNER